jgi:hypothetical protein
VADITINGGTVFAEGTSVGAYLRSQWPVESTTGAPSGSAVASGTVTNGVVTFTGLADAATYIAYASSPDRYKRFSTPPPSAVSSGAAAGRFGATGIAASPVADADGVFDTIVSDGMHNAFPGLVRYPDGSWLHVFRRGTSHVNSKGVIYKQTRASDTAAWSAESVAYSHATLDVRDPCLTILSDGRTAMTCFVEDATTAAGILNGLRLLFSSDKGATWGAPITPADPFTSWASCSSPLVEYQGALLWGWQGRNTGDGFGSSTLGRSTDGGLTWTPRSSVVADGMAVSKNLAEPNLLVAADGGLLFVTRDSTNKVIEVRKSTTDWQTFAAINASFAGNGAPRMLKFASGVIFLVTRAADDGLAVFAYSTDNGATFTSGLPLDNVNSSDLEMTYGTMVEIAPDIAYCAYGSENVGQTVSNIFGRYMFARPGVAPNGVIARPNGIVGRTLCAHVYSDAAFAVPTGGGQTTPIPFNQERYDKGRLHSKTVNNSRLTAPVDGVYRIIGMAEFASGAGTYRSLQIMRAGSTVIAIRNQTPVSGLSTRLIVETDYFLAAGDYVELRPLQDTGANLNINASASYSPDFMMSLVTPA